MGLPHTSPARGGIILEESARVGIKMLLRNGTGPEPDLIDGDARFKLDTTRHRRSGRVRCVAARGSRVTTYFFFGFALAAAAPSTPRLRKT
jgi:hypothetical protein